MQMAVPKCNSGYDYECVLATPKHVECPICLLTLRDAHVTSCCGNHFCQRCIGQVRDENKPCPLCNESGFTTLLHKGIVREVKSLKIRCPHRELGCDWEGELGQVEQHLNPREGSSESGCSFMLVECSNKCGKKVARIKMQDHEMNECLKRPVEMQMSNLAKKFEQMKTDFGKQLETLIAENKAIREDNSVLRTEVETVRWKNEAVKAQNEMVVSENKVLKRNIKRLQASCAHLDSRITPVPPFYFTMHNVEHYKKVNLTWWSPSFYSHLAGYKVSINIDVNGFGVAKGNHLSLFAAIMKGEFDNQLQWPFEGIITVQMYNWSMKKWDYGKSITFYDAPLEYKQKPLLGTLGNHAWGVENSISHKQLRNVCFGDCIRFRVSDIELHTFDTHAI